MVLEGCVISPRTENEKKKVINIQSWPVTEPRLSVVVGVHFWHLGQYWYDLSSVGKNDFYLRILSNRVCYHAD